MESSNFCRDQPWACGFLIFGVGFLVLILLWCWCKRAVILPVISTAVQLFILASYGTLRESLHCQVVCYGQGDVHTDILRLLHISDCEYPEIPIVLFVYKVSRETEDLRNALLWIEGNQGRKREDICAVILLEKSSYTDKKPVEVAHLGMFDDKTAVVRILYDRWISCYELREKIQKGPNTNRALDRIKQSILG